MTREGDAREQSAGVALEPATWAADRDPLLPSKHRPPARGGLPRRKRDILRARVPLSGANAVPVPTLSPRIGPVFYAESGGDDVRPRIFPRSSAKTPQSISLAVKLARERAASRSRRMAIGLRIGRSS